MRKHPTRSQRQDPEVGDTRLEDLVERVIPHFEAYPLLSGKRHDFGRFAAVCSLTARGARRDRDGLVRIVEPAGDESERAPAVRR